MVPNRFMLRVGALLLALAMGVAASPAAAGVAGDRACTDCPSFDQDDAKIRVRHGKRFVIVLESNPTTGYRWSVTAIADRKVVTRKANVYVEPDTERIGAAGTQRLVFEARRKGKTTIDMRYARSFEPDDPDATELTFTVTVT